jgi:hypothetical protein
MDVEGLRVGVVHGGKSNAARDETVAAFREGRVWVLVVTEVMARGMDFGGVKVVVNYGTPLQSPKQSRTPESSPISYSVQLHPCPRSRHSPPMKANTQTFPKRPNPTSTV